MSWDQRFYRPAVLPDGKTLRTLDDARLHILSLPKSEHDTAAWQVAIEALLVAANVSESEIEKPVGAFSQMARLQHDREYFDAAYWRKRARGTMAKAAATYKQEVRERLLKVANEYEAIALRAERRADPPTK